LARRCGAVLVLLVLVVGAIGCGEDEGVASGATVRVYVAAPLCSEARSALAARHGRAGDLRVEAICLAPMAKRGRLDLAVAGANARRATQDSAAIAFLESPGPAGRFTRTIVEEAGIAWERAVSGESSMTAVLRAIDEAGSGSLRDQVRKDLETSPA
jgi:hypothetical protein